MERVTCCSHSGAARAARSRRGRHRGKHLAPGSRGSWPRWAGVRATGPCGGRVPAADGRQSGRRARWPSGCGRAATFPRGRGPVHIRMARRPTRPARTARTGTEQGQASLLRCGVPRDTKGEPAHGGPLAWQPGTAQHGRRQRKGRAHSPPLVRFRTVRNVATPPAAPPSPHRQPGPQGALEVERRPVDGVAAGVGRLAAAGSRRSWAACGRKAGHASAARSPARSRL